MLLIIQIGLGILLGFLLIQYRHHLTKAVLFVAVAVIALLAVSALIYAGHEVVTSPAISERTARLWTDAARLAVVVPCLILGAVSGLPLSGLFHRLFKRRGVTEAVTKPVPDDATDWALVKWGFANVFITMAGYYALAAITPVGEIGDAIDAYGRANGWDDGLSMISFVALMQWTWVAFWITTKVQRVRENKA